MLTHIDPFIHSVQAHNHSAVAVGKMKLKTTMRSDADADLFKYALPNITESDSHLVVG